MDEKEKWTLKESEIFEDFVADSISDLNEKMKEDIQNNKNKPQG